MVLVVLVGVSLKPEFTKQHNLFGEGRCPMLIYAIYHFMFVSVALVRNIPHHQRRSHFI